MEVVGLQVFVSLILALGSVLLFGVACRARTFDHADRLALLPLRGDDAAKAAPSTLAPEESPMESENKPQGAPS